MFYHSSSEFGAPLDTLDNWDAKGGCSTGTVGGWTLKATRKSRLPIMVGALGQGVMDQSNTYTCIRDAP